MGECWHQLIPYSSDNTRTALIRDGLSPDLKSTIGRRYSDVKT